MKVRWALAALVMVLGMGGAEGQTTAAGSGQGIQTSAMIKGIGDSVHQMAYAVVAYPGVAEADKEKMRALIKAFDAGVQKVQEGVKDQADWQSVYMRARLIAMSEQGMLLSTAMHGGKADLYAETLEEAGVAEAKRE